ncbi:hypothetical protein ACLOJK_003960 [Asimina triloba]
MLILQLKPALVEIESRSSRKEYAQVLAECHRLYCELVSDGRNFESVKTMSHVGLGQFIDADNIIIIYGALSSDSMENQYQLFQRCVRSCQIAG